MPSGLETLAVMYFIAQWQGITSVPLYTLQWNLYNWDIIADILGVLNTEVSPLKRFLYKRHIQYLQYGSSHLIFPCKRL